MFLNLSLQPPLCLTNEDLFTAVGDLVYHTGLLLWRECLDPLPWSASSIELVQTYIEDHFDVVPSAGIPRPDPLADTCDL